MAKKKLRTEWKPGEPELTEEEMAAISEALEKENLQHIEQHGPRFRYDEIAIRVQGAKEWKRRNHLDGFNSISIERMLALSKWPTQEDGEMDALVGVLLPDGYEDREHPYAPRKPIEWRFIRDVIRPEKKDRLRSLFEIKAKEQAARAELARAVLRGDSPDEIEVKVADLRQIIMDTMLPVLTGIQQVVVDNAQGKKDKGRTLKYAKALTREWKNRCDIWREEHPDKAFTPKEKEYFVINHFKYDEHNLSPGEEEQVKNLAAHLRLMFDAGKPRKKSGS